MLVVRREIDSDRAAIRYLLEQAFGSQVEATLVEALRHRHVLILSLVATDRDRLVGHIAFSPVTIEPEGASLNAVGLAPLAVLPEYQQQGIGSQLVEIGLEECQKADFDAVFVLGHPSFYSRFGFIPASTYGIRFSADVPPEAFMVKEFTCSILSDRAGIVLFQHEFQSV